MKTPKLVFVASLFIAVISIIYISCRKESSTNLIAPPGKQSVQVFLNDDPVLNLSKLLIDIRYIEVKVDTGQANHDDEYYNNDHEGDSDNDGEHQDQDNDDFGKWDTLSVTPRVYDMLNLKNGKDNLIANGFVSNGKIYKLRITLGTNNEVWTDSTHHYPLSICENEKYVYVKIPSQSVETLPSGQKRIRLDINVGKSVELENGVYCFNPEVKSYCDETSGRIEGKVQPADAKAMVMAFNTTDTAYAIPEGDDDGEFKIKGMKPGTYSVLYKATLPYKDTLVANVQVQAGKETKLSTVVLHK